MHFFAQTPLRANTEAVADYQHPDHQFRSYRWAACVAVMVRQVLAEFGHDAIVRSVCDGPGILERVLVDLLPDAFGGDSLA